MKKIILISAFIVSALTSCKKDDWVTPIQIGSKFNYDKPYLLKKPDNSIPVNPFTVDSVNHEFYGAGRDGYFVTSSNGLVYTMDAPAIRRGLIK